ncbi:MAG: N-acetylneuraminate synthase family protein, partial [Thermodesulfovibrionales bacterium]|nr:N-acetylneuraminate synthase family protein [Thermodesulfovibrionales bacterium]
MEKVLNIGDRTVGQGSPVFVIAELGINHNGDPAVAGKLVREAVASGADAVKLQTYITEKRVPRDSPIFDLLKGCELSFDEQSELFRLGAELGVTVFSTPFDDESLEFLKGVGCP